MLKDNIVRLLADYIDKDSMCTIGNKPILCTELAAEEIIDLVCEALYNHEDICGFEDHSGNAMSDVP